MSLNNEQPENYNLRNKVVVFTGKLRNFTRDQATEIVESRGGRVDRSVTYQTHYLIYGEDVGQTKTQAAAKKGVQLRSEQWLMAAAMVNTPGFVPRKSGEVRVQSAPPAQRGYSVLSDYKLKDRPKQEEDLKPKTRRVRVA